MAQHASAVVDQVDGYVNADRTGFFLLRDGDQRVWGVASAYIGCGEARWVRPGVPATPIALWSRGDICRALPIALRGGALWIGTPLSHEQDPAPSVSVTRVELATDARTPWRDLPGATAAGSFSAGDDGYVLAYSLRNAGAARLMRFSLAPGDQDEGWIGPTIHAVGAVGRIGDDPV